MEHKPYRTAFITQSSGHSFSPILEHCENLKFITTGYESMDGLIATIREALKDYSPEQDVLVPVGSVLSSFVIGYFARERCISVDAEFLNLGIYADKKYSIIQIGEDNGIPS